MKKMLMLIGLVMSVVVAFGDPKPKGGPYTETVEEITWTFMVDANLNASVGTGVYGGTAVPKSRGGCYHSDDAGRSHRDEHRGSCVFQLRRFDERDDTVKRDEYWGMGVWLLLRLDKRDDTGGRDWYR